MGEKGQQIVSIQDEEAFKQILQILFTRKGIDFAYYKRPTILRRIDRRMGLKRITCLSSYLQLLQGDPSEQDALYQDLLIPVTQFFRDKPVFDHLCNIVFPELISRSTATGTIRIWVAACSTGEEAYSIAMCLAELIGTSAIKVQVFATDISARAIAVARAGVYTQKNVLSIGEQRLGMFFTKVDGCYRISKSIRNMCVFAEHNFLKDPPFRNIDFMSCRNALIYLEPYLQKKALTNFHYAVNPKGLLLLGKSESGACVPHLFVVTDKPSKLFSRIDTPARYLHVASQQTIQHLHQLTTIKYPQPMQTDFQKTADDIILNQYSPVGVVVNELMDIVHFRGDTSTYLRQASGAPTHHLLKQANPDLAFELRILLQKAKNEGKPFSKDAIPIRLNDSTINVTIKVIPLLHIAEPHYLVLFQNTPYPAPTITYTSADDEKDRRIKQLEDELLHAREDMRNLSEEQETANEELQSANEELLSSGEEMQSLNEELETSKEELQSSNEGLTSINMELHNLYEQVNAAKNYAESVVQTIQHPLLVLDQDLRVKTANPAFYKMFGLVSLETEGKLIYDLGEKGWDIPKLRDLLEDTLTQSEAFTDIAITHTFKRIGTRVLLFRGTHIINENEKEKLILLAIEDITDKSVLQSKETELLDKFQTLVGQTSVAMCILKGNDYVVDLANDSYLALVEQGPDFIGRPLFESLPDLPSQGIKSLLDKVMASGEPHYSHERELCLQRNSKREHCYFNFVYQPMLSPTDTVTGIIVVVTEVTDQVAARIKLENQANMVHEILMTAPGWICTLRGPDHVFDIVNAKYQAVFGNRVLKGFPILQALPELAGQGIQELLDEVYKTGKSFVGYDIPISISRDEDAPLEVCYFNFSYQAIYDEEKSIRSILAFGYEVTEQVIAKNKILEIQLGHARDLEARVKQRTMELISANELLQHKNKKLKKANKELESFTYLSSHDLQEPLRKIQTFSEMILVSDHAVLSDKGKDYFRRMQLASRRMQALIQDLLTYSKVETPDQEIVCTNLNKLLSEVLADFADKIIEIKAILQIGILGDAHILPFHFSQVMNNLISNSLKFARPELQLTITIDSKVDSGAHFQDSDNTLIAGQLFPDNQYMHIRYSDNGIGFDQQYAERIFEIFQRLHGKAEYEGTGIGLAIVKRIVERHGGVITATGQINEGAIFNIYIPA